MHFKVKKILQTKLIHFNLHFIRTNIINTNKNM